MRPKVVRLIQSDGSIHEYDATGHDLHIDQPLTEVLINYRPSGMIADQVLPLVEVGKQSDLYYEFDQGDLWRIPDTVRAPMTGAKMVSFNVSSNTYFAKNYALAAGIPVEDAMNADAALRLRESKGRFIMDLLTLDWENRLATLVINTSNVGTFATVTGSLWSNHADSDPVTDIDDAIKRVRDATGYLPNRMVLGWRAWQDLKRNNTLRSLIFPAPGATQPTAGLMNTDQVAKVFDLEKVLIGGTVRNTAAEGLDLTLADIWGPHALIYYSPGAPSRETPAYGYTFRWVGPMLQNLTVMDLGFDKRLKGNILDVGFYQDEKITGSAFGTVLGSVV